MAKSPTPRKAEPAAAPTFTFLSPNEIAEKNALVVADFQEQRNTVLATLKQKMAAQITAAQTEIINHPWGFDCFKDYRIKINLHNRDFESKWRFTWADFNNILDALQTNWEVQVRVFSQNGDTEITITAIKPLE